MWCNVKGGECHECGLNGCSLELRGKKTCTNFCGKFGHVCGTNNNYCTGCPVKPVYFNASNRVNQPQNARLATLPFM